MRAMFRGPFNKRIELTVGRWTHEERFVDPTHTQLH